MIHVDVEEIDWVRPSVPIDLACSVCGHRDGNREVLRVPLKTGAVPRPLRTYRCAGCGSICFDISEPASYETMGGEKELVWRHYLEVGAGPFEMIWPAAIVSGDAARSLLEVGCGFGYCLAYWQMQGGTAVGVENATYGEMGRKALGVEILGGYLPHVPELDGRRFDLISASEVIEHVTSPGDFVKTLKSYLNPSGVLVLTTPNAEFVSPDNDPSVLLAQISAGFHAFLLSPAAFGRILHEAGFAHVKVQSFGERLIAWASDQPIRLTSPESIRPNYFRFLFGLLDSLPADGPLFDGIAYRALKEAVNAGQADAARHALRRLEQRLVAAWGPSAVEPEQALAVSQGLSSFEQIVRHFPFFLPVYFYFRGLLAVSVERDPVLAARCFQGAFAVGLLWTRIASQLNLETLSCIWPSRVQQIGTQFSLGDYRGAVRLLAEMFAQRGRCTREFGYAIPSAQFVENTLRQGYDACLSRHETGQAEQVRSMLETIGSERNAGTAAAPATASPQPLAAPSLASTAFVIAHYHERGRVPLHLRALVEYLRTQTPHVVFVSTRLEPEAAEALAPLARVIVRDNFGYDFWSYKIGVDALGDWSAFERIVILNSSFLVLDPELLCERFFASPAQADLRSLMFSRELAPHLQSFWVSFENRRVIGSPAFAAWWGDMLPISNKQHVIERYELGMSKHFADRGFHLAAACVPDRRQKFLAFCRAVENRAASVDAGTSGPLVIDPEIGDAWNPSHYTWEALLQQFGVVKLDLLQKNPARLNIGRLRPMLDSDPRHRALVEDLFAND